jgi:Zn-dependent protease
LAEFSFFDSVKTYLLNILPLLVCFVAATIANSYARAWVAYHYGDSTPKVAGRLTLIPIHFDWVGTIFFLLFYPGWGKPVPVNLTNLGQKRSRIALIELSGVAANLALGLASLVVFWLLMKLEPLLNLDLRTFKKVFELFGTFNVFHAVFQLLPIPPLSGFRILTGLFYHKPQGVLDSWVINLVGAAILMILFIWTPLLSYLAIGTQAVTGLLQSSGAAYFSYFSLAFFGGY